MSRIVSRLINNRRVNKARSLKRIKRRVVVVELIAYCRQKRRAIGWFCAARRRRTRWNAARRDAIARRHRISRYLHRRQVRKYVLRRINSASLFMQFHFHCVYRLRRSVNLEDFCIGSLLRFTYTFSEIEGELIIRINQALIHLYISRWDLICADKFFFTDHLQNYCSSFSFENALLAIRVK